MAHCLCRPTPRCWTDSPLLLPFWALQAFPGRGQALTQSRHQPVVRYAQVPPLPEAKPGLQGKGAEIECRRYLGSCLGLLDARNGLARDGRAGLRNFRDMWAHPCRCRSSGNPGHQSVAHPFAWACSSMSGWKEACSGVGQTQIQVLNL